MLYSWLLLLILPSPDHAAEQTCHDSVLFHHGESILPSTDLFCVIRSNQEQSDEKVPIIQTEEQWLEFVSENPSLDYEGDQNESSPPVLLTRDGDHLTEFLIPASFFGSKCTATQEVVLGFSQSTACTPEFTSFSESECLSNKFLSAQSLFGSPLVSLIGNRITETMFRTNTTLMAAQWTDGQCRNVIEEVTMEITLNDTLIVDAELPSIKYSTLMAQNHTIFRQKFTVIFKDHLESPQENKERGYQRGDEIYAMKDDLDAPFLFSLPLAGLCETHSRVPIKFLVNSSSTCTIRVSQCQEMQKVVQQLEDELVPKWVKSVPDGTVSNETYAQVIRKNRTEVQDSPGTTCFLNTDFLFFIYYAREGSERSHRLVIKSAAYATNNNALSLTDSAIIRFSVQFKDSTPRKTHILNFFQLIVP
uniref:TCTN_DUF1619 domain-containing protein n=1 Tax=Haemonchus contortus TaxID=6289 RepID=A0A7I4YM60_HAECO